MSGANSFHRIFLHLTWACREHAPLIRPAIELELNQSVRNYIAQFPGIFFKAAATNRNHLHLAIQMAPNIILTDASARINKKYGPDTLLWQHGYAAASFAAENLDAVARYILDQQMHHERGTTRTALEPPAEGENRNDIYLHATWHCHRDQRMITPDIENIITEFLPGYCTKSGFEFLGWGGTDTHMHIAFKPVMQMKISETIGKLKGATTYHVNGAVGRKALQWQHGYGVVSFAGKNMNAVLDYIHNQKEHHRKLTIDEMLERCGFPVREAR